MQAERDCLRDFIIPRVEEELQKRRIKLEIVDLRWGVDTTSIEQEEERELNVLKVCLDEIRRSRPFFIGLLGDRYGWVPPEKRMSDALVGEPQIKTGNGKSVTDLEIEFGVLGSKEQMVRSVFYFRNPLPYENFPKGKVALFSDALNTEFPSAEREFRVNALKELKANIKNHFKSKNLSNKVKTYTAAWDVSAATVCNLETWAGWVYDDILAECENHARDTWDTVPQNWQEQELALLNSFIEQHTHISTFITDKGTEEVQTFCGREKLLLELKNHLLSLNPYNWGHIITGESGSGKSAVFSKVYKNMKQEDCILLAHSAGLSPRAKHVTDLLQIWNTMLCDFLNIRYEQTENEATDHFEAGLAGNQKKSPIIPIEKLQAKFLEYLTQAAKRKRVVLLIDALDRFESSAIAQYMSWLPSEMPQNVRLLCTAITGTEQKAVHYHKGLTAKSIDEFSKEEAEEMLFSLCKKQHKTLAAKPTQIILEKKRKDGRPAITSPLWVNLSVNMLIALDGDDFEKISILQGRADQNIDTYIANLADTFDPMPGPLFISLAEKAGQVFGSALTKSVLDFIAVSRNGLRERDLEKLLPAKTWDPLQFANLRRWFRSLMILQGEEQQWNFGHSILRSAKIENSKEDSLKEHHGKIADYLRSLSNDSLKATETVYHLISAGKLKEAAGYYGSDLTAEEAEGATLVLAETATGGGDSLALVCALPDLLYDDFESFHRLVERFVYELNNALKLGGNLVQRLTLLEEIESVQAKLPEDKSRRINFGYVIGNLYSGLGNIHKSLGHTEKALGFFEKENQLKEVLYQAGSWSISIKESFALSYANLSEIHASMGHMEEAYNFARKYNELEKEIYEEHPGDEIQKYNYAVSFERLGSIYEALGYMAESIQFYENYNRLAQELYQADLRSELMKGILATSYSKLGDLHHSMTHFETALDYYERENRLTKELFQVNPGRESSKEALSNSYKNLGVCHESMGQLAEALRFLEFHNKLVEELHHGNPESESLKESLAGSYAALGGTHQMMNHLEKSFDYYMKCNQLEKELYRANPRSESIKTGLANSWSSLGSIYELAGQPDEALTCFERCNQLEKELTTENPSSEQANHNLAISYDKLGTIQQSMGQIDSAYECFRIFNKIKKELFEKNPINEMLKINLACSCEKLGSIHVSMGLWEEALKNYEDYRRLQKELSGKNTSNIWIKNGLARAYEKLGTLHHSMDHLEKALEFFIECNNLEKEIFQSSPQNDWLKHSLACSYLKLGEIHLSSGNTKNAIVFLHQYNVFEKQLNEDNPGNTEFLEGLGISYYKLALAYKLIGNSSYGSALFRQWKNIASFLAQNMPQVSKYSEWVKLEYED